jgi:peroxiredoxin
MDADAIDASFVPRPRPDLAFVEVDGEAVIAAPAGAGAGAVVHWLDPIATIVWQCLDGRVSVEALVAELAGAFAADPTVVADDVLGLCRALARAGLLEGVAGEARARDLPAAPDPRGLPVGVEAPPFTRPDLDGRDRGLEGWRGRRVLLVNWSPDCAFCAGIAHELAALGDELAALDTVLVLVASGSAAENQELARRAGLDATVVLRGAEPVDLFRGLATPSAYLIDERGAIASGLAIGAAEVPALARIAAGRHESPGDRGAVG